MLGLVMRAATPGGSTCYMIMGVLAVCGIWRLCCGCKIRNCRCIKRLLRCTGHDPFDEFEMMILIHGVKFTTTSQTTTQVKIRAGDIATETDPNTEGVFQQTVNLLVEQGTESIEFELLDTRNKVLAQLRMEVMKDILKNGSPVSVVEKVFHMKQKQKTVLNPKITLTFSPEQMGDEEKALLSGLNASAETEWMLTQHIQLVQSKEADNPSGRGGGKPVAECSEVELLAKACAGPLEMFEKMGGKREVYIGIVGPPAKKKYALRVWQCEHDMVDGKAHLDEIDLLKVMGISADPSRPEVFCVDYVDDKKSKRTLKFSRVDRGRDVWVEMLQLLVQKVHAERKMKKEKGK